MPLIAVTRLRLRSLRHLPGFLWLTFRSRTQARRAPGHLETRLLKDAKLAFWTMSAWENELAMRAYMVSGAHRTAMQWLKHVCDEAAIVHWLQESAELPDWLAAHRRMVAEGRPSNVHHPSPAHLAGVIAEPQL